MEMAFSHLGYSSNVTLGTNQSPVTSSTCEPLGNLLSSYSSSLSPPDNHLVGLYNPAYAAAAVQSRFFSLGSPTGPSPPGTQGGVCPGGPPVQGSMGGGGGGPVESPAFYPGYAVSRDMTTPWRPGASTNHFAGGPHAGYPYDHTSWQTAYAYPGSHALDLNGTRRKNATRESTATLKAWLQEHIKNPYPTKGEKIMLAIITKMTLTQVSTWFANARRRLKKENKMTWSPRNRTDDGDMDDSSKDGVDMEMGNVGRGGSGGLHEASEGLPLGGSQLLCGLERTSAGLVDASKESSPDRFDDSHKPKIWSLAMTATSCGTFSFHHNNNNNNSLPPSIGIGSLNVKNFPPSGVGGSGGGGCLSPLNLGGIGGPAATGSGSGGITDHQLSSIKRQPLTGSSPPQLQLGRHHGGGHFFSSAAAGGGTVGLGGMPRLLDSSEGM